MQLNSITIMDLVAYGGAAAGMVMAVTQFSAGRVGLGGCLAILLLAADFFLPMRQLGSFFHIAMNGMAATDKIFRLLDLPEPQQGAAPVPADCAIHCSGLRFAMTRSGRFCRASIWTCPWAALPPLWARAAAASPPWRRS